MDDANDDGLVYAVVVNHEGFHSIWIVDRALPPGWSHEGTQGSRRDCLDHIDRVWTDMRPLSLRRAAETRPPDA